MKLRHTIALLLLPGLPAQPAWAIGGTESMDRPSARPLQAPQYQTTTPAEGLTLPVIPELDQPISSERSFAVARIILQGNTVFDEALGDLTSSYQNRTLSLAEIEELRQQLTRYYIERGYINSGALIAADAIKDDVLTIQIVEGRLDDIQIKGQERLREGYIKNRLQPDAEQPFNLTDLQDRFQTLLSDPLIEKMNGRLLPGNSLGHSILDVDVVRAQPYHLSVYGDNYRPPSIGGEAFGLTSWVRNLTGLGDLLEFGFVTSGGADRYMGGFSLPISDWGTQAFFRFDEGASAVIEEPLDRLDIKSQVHNLEGGISQTLINTLNQKISVGAMLAVRENATTFLGEPFSFVNGESTGRNQATVWRLFQDGAWRWEKQALAVRSTFSVGMDALGATPKTSDRFPSSEFFAWLGQAQYAIRVLEDGSQIVLRGNAQFSDAPLLPLEQIAVGGVSSVRGYRENYRVRDNGYSLSLEFHYPLFDDTTLGYQHRLSLVPFADCGQAWNVWDTDHESANHLYSVGVGLNWQFSRFSSDFYYGHAFSKSSAGNNGDLQDDGVHFQTRLTVF